MKKRILFITFIMFFICLLNFGCSENNTQNDISTTNEETVTDNPPKAKISPQSDVFEFEEKNGSIIITGLKDKTVTDVVIPEKLGSFPVTEIADGAFKGNTTIKSLFVPDTVVKMGYGILSECKNLTKLSLPFTGEKHRTEKELSDRPFGYIFGEKEYAGGESTMQFYHDNKADEVEMVYNYIPVALKKVTITGKENTHIPYGAFYNCTNIQTLTIGENVTSIGEFAFSGVVGKIEWDNPQIKVIGEHAFEDFKGTTLTIPESVTEIQYKGYSDCVYVKNCVIPDSVKTVGDYAFSYCYDLKSITFGKKVETLGAETFYFSYNLTSVKLNDGLTFIDDGAFDSCYALTSIEIPTSVNRINANAFKSCTNLKSAIFKNANGWRCYNTSSSKNSISEIKLNNTATAAEYLTKTYREYIWEKAS